MSREIMQQALDALKYHTEHTYPFHLTNVAIELLQKELAKPEQEPKLTDAGADTNIEPFTLYPKGSGMVILNQPEQEHMFDTPESHIVKWSIPVDPNNFGEPLMQPEQEPVAWRNAAIRLGEDLYSVGPNGYYDMTAKQWLDWALSVVNTTPSRKEWVGLTDKEMFEIWRQHGSYETLFKKVEIKLKEKNT